MGELRTWKPAREVLGRSGENREQWHNDKSTIEDLKRGLFHDYTEEELQPDQKKLRAESLAVWSADNSFLWDWDGIPENVKALAKHRQPNYITQGISELYHAMLTPPVTASCGHRCVAGRATVAYEQSRSIHRLMAYEGHYWGANTDYPEITPDNINHLLNLMHSRHGKPERTCCRCYNAQQWFGLEPKTSTASGYAQAQSFFGVTSKQIYKHDGHPETMTLRMEDGQWYEECDGQAYYANVVNERKVEGKYDTSHIGWHAGLLRPRFHFRNSEFTNDYNTHRPQWFSNIRLADKKAVVSGLHSPKRYLCPNCLTAAKGLPAHLYWAARGLSHKAARERQQHEFVTLQGKGNRWLQNTNIDLKNWQQIGHLYGT